MKLHTWLSKHDKSVAWLAEETGLSRSYLSRLGVAERSPSMETCAKIEKATGGDVTANDFMPEEEEPVPKKPARPKQREVSRAA